MVLRKMILGAMGLALLLSCNQNNEPQGLVEAFAEGLAYQEALNQATGGATQSTPVNPNRAIGGSIVDANTGDPVVATVFITGSGLDSLTGLPSTAATSGIQAENGFVNLMAKEGLTLSEDSPLELTVAASASGYVTGSKKVVVDGSGEISFTIPLVNISSPPEGVAVSTATVNTDSSGAVTSPVSVQTAGASDAGNTAKLEIPAGTVIRDKDGNPLSGDLTATVAYFSNNSGSALDAFPGGLEADIASDASGNPAEGTFISGGLVAAEIEDASGAKAKTFSSPLQLTAQTPAATVNPETGAALKAGDTIGVWSLDEGTGKWSHEGVSTASMDGSGNFNFAFDASHFSYYNLDWHYGPKCRKTTGKLQIEGKPPGVALKLVLTWKDGNGSGWRKVKWLNRGETWVGFFNAPRNLPTTITAYYEGVAVGTLDVDDLCSLEGKVLQVNLADVQVQDLQIQASLSCPSLGLEFGPNLFLRYRRVCSGSWWECPGWQTTYMNNGSLTLSNLVTPAVYKVSAYSHDYSTWIVHNHEVSLTTAPPETLTLTAEYCPGTGSGSGTGTGTSTGTGTGQ